MNLYFISILISFSCCYYYSSDGREEEEEEEEEKKKEMFPKEKEVERWRCT